MGALARDPSPFSPVSPDPGRNAGPVGGRKVGRKCTMITP